MKKLITFILFLLVTNFVISQSSNITYPTDKTFMYGGEMTKDLFNLLNRDEQCHLLKIILIQSIICECPTKNPRLR